MIQSYQSQAEKNGVVLLNEGPCQFCGGKTTRGVHECVELFSLGFDLIDYGKATNHIYRFLSVDAHALQHPEIHGRWNNHFHLTRLHLIFAYEIKWQYPMSPRLSGHLNEWVVKHPTSRLEAPILDERGSITTVDVLRESTTEEECQEMIQKWAREVYRAWRKHRSVVDDIARNFQTYEHR